jgi:predicted permease
MTRHRDDDELPLSGVPPVDEDVRRELEFHIEQRASELIAAGHTPERARALARELFGDRQMVEAECREIESRRRETRRRERRLEALRHDARVGLRLLLRSPGFTLAAVLTLALGIGANAAVFSIVNRVLLQPLPYLEADRLTTLIERHEQGWGTLSWSNFLDVEAQSRSFAGLASYGSAPVTVLGRDAAMRVGASAISSGFFRVFPIRPTLGRVPAAEEHLLGANPVAVVSHAFWRDRLGAPSSLDGVRVRMDQDYSVVGVLAPGFAFPAGTDIWVPLELRDQSMSRTAHNWNVIGRLQRGVSPDAAEREVDGILGRLRALHSPDFDAVGSTVTPLQDVLTASSRKPLYLLLGASALLLLAACSNLAGAMLARGTARAGEIALRSALGATRTRLVRQLLTESALLSMLGCLTGLGLAWLLLRGLPFIAPATLPLPEVAIDVWVLGFAALVAVATAVLFGLLPALRLSDAGTGAMLREGSRGTADASRSRAWNVLLAAEVALAVMLLTGSGLLIRSFARVMDTELGFDPSARLAMRLNLPAVNYADNAPTIPGFHQRLLDALRGTPGLEAAGFINVLPLEGNNPSGGMQVEGKPLNARGTSTGYAVYRVVGGDYFRAMDIPVLRGRVFTDADDRSAPPVVVVSETFARTEWPDEDPLGKRLRPAGMDRSEESWHTVIGVVGDIRGASVTDAYRPYYYFDHRQRPSGRTRSVSWVVRTTASQVVLSGALQRAVRSVDPQVPNEIRPLPRLVSDAVADRRFTMVVLGGFSLVALFLAVIGVYAVVSYSVAQRTREIGVRLALGGTPGRMRSMVLLTSMRAVVPGLLAGGILALAGANVLRTLLYDVSPFDTAALGGAILLLGVAAAASSLLPAIHATRVDPMIAMRAE